MPLPPVPSIDADALTLGPAARIFYLQTDSLGRARYRVEKRRERTVPFGTDHAEAFYAVIDQIMLAAFLRPPATRLRALACYGEPDDLTVLLGDEWGYAIAPDGARRRLLDPLAEMRRLGVPLYQGERDSSIGLRMGLNPHYRELFGRELRQLIRPEKRNTLEIFFHTPSGAFDSASIVIQERLSQRILRRFVLHDFPLAWPDDPILEEKGDRTPPIAPTRSQVYADETPRPSSRRRAASQSRRPRAPHGASWETLGASPPAKAQEPPTQPPLTEPKARPIPRTVNLPPAEAVEKTAAESEPDRRWAMIEENLMLASPGRTYHFLARFGPEIGAGAAPWPIQQVVTLLGEQPAALLAAVVSAWPLDRALALAEVSAEKDYFLEYLREREIERLMEMDESEAPRDRNEAARWLGISTPDLPSGQVKRVWRRLLGYLNSDFGRTSEQAIHRRKDEIAKRLQQARDVLTK